MPEVGDVYRVSTTVTDVDGTLVDPAAITLTVTDPSSAASNPAPANDGTGLYHADVALTAAGRWRWKWETTTPTRVDHGHIDVPVEPPGRLLPLATVDDLEARLGASLSTAQAARAPALLADASVTVRRFCRQDFDLVTGDSVVIRPIGKTLRLPQRPVLAVTAVVAVGSNGIPDIALSGWTFDGVDVVNIDGLNSDVFVSYPAWFDDVDTDINTYRVTYDHGYPVTPDDIKGKVCQMVNRVLTADTLVEGVTQETIGQYSRQWQQGTGATGITPILTRADRQDLIDWGYRRVAGTIQTHVR